jgi:type I restriction enzyme S subunit
MHKNENRPGYKKTKVGWIPEGWKDSRLKDCAAKIGSGITPKGGSETYLAEGIPLIRSQNVLDGEFSSDGLIYISDEQHRAMKGSALQPNDVLFNITGASIGRCCLFPAHFGEANVNQHVCIVRLKKTCHPKLFVNILNSHITKRQLHENQAGGGREGLNFQNLGGFRIPHPPLPEQEAIAEVLECWDRGIRNLELKIVKKRLIKKGLMQKLLSGQTRLPGFSKPWKNVRLGKICDLYQPQTISQKDLKPTGFPVYGANGLIGFYDQFNHETWQVMITCRGSTCGTVNKTKGKCWITGNAMVANVDQHSGTDKLFLYYCLSSHNFTAVISGSGQPQIVRGPLSKFPLHIPEGIEEQQAIAEVLSAADREIEALERKLALWENQKNFLLNNLVTGTIRLPEFRKDFYPPESEAINNFRRK